MFHTHVTLIQTVYRALLTSAVSGIGHRIHTPKKTTVHASMRPGQFGGRAPVCAVAWL